MLYRNLIREFSYFYVLFLYIQGIVFNFLLILTKIRMKILHKSITNLLFFKDAK
jgi:hypothetical protein